MNEYFILPYNQKNKILFLPLEKKVFLVDSKISNFKLKNIITKFFNKSTKPLINNVPKVYFTTLALELTNNCNLNCIYCYAKSGKDKIINMSWDIAKYSVDFFIKHLKGKRYVFNLSFFGTGESTLNWNLLKKISKYTMKECKKNKIKFNIEIGNTNGTTLNKKERIEWIIKNIKRIYISFDGPKKIQNKNRPYKNGKGTFEDILSFIKKLNGKIKLGIKCSVNSYNVAHMKDLIKLFKEKKIKINSVHFGKTVIAEKEISKRYYNYLKLFYKEYKKAKLEGIKNKITISCGGEYLLDQPHIFHCGANGNGLLINAQGKLSLCPFAASKKEDSPFIVGYYDLSKKKFIINKKRIKEIQKRTVYKLKECQNCFAKYYCAGNCLAIPYFKTGSFYNIFKQDCNLQRKILYDRILEQINLNKITKIKKNHFS